MCLFVIFKLLQSISNETATSLNNEITHLQMQVHMSLFFPFILLGYRMWHFAYLSALNERTSYSYSMVPHLF